ncbi:MAG: hypothetical protein OES24_09895 [Acidimicrobiia bacterium]|nr:hypothetical protein [Acidimicrobiia bacterium]
MNRRAFLIKGGLAVGGLALLGSRFASGAMAADSPYGPLGPSDGNGMALPPGFSSRVVAVTGAAVGATSHVWHPNPDGGATFAQPDEGRVYVSNNAVISRGRIPVAVDDVLTFEVVACITGHRTWQSDLVPAQPSAPGPTRVGATEDVRSRWRIPFFPADECLNPDPGRDSAPAKAPGKFTQFVVLALDID